MQFRPDLVEPLLRVGLDFYAENQNGEPAYKIQPWVASDDETIPRLLLSRGIYDDVVGKKMTWWTISSMMQNAQVFDIFVQKFFPNFYQSPLKLRLRMLRHSYIRQLDPKVIGRIFHPDGRFRLDDLRWRARSSTGKTTFEHLLWAYFAMRLLIWFVRITGKGICSCTDACRAAFGKHDPGISPITNINVLGHQWSEMRVTMREAVSIVDYSDLCGTRTGTGRTALIGAMELFRRKMKGRTSPRQHRHWRHETQEMVRDWLEDLQAAGKDLEVYGRGEMAAFLGQSPSSQARWSHGSKKAGYRWSGFTVGPRPEDWNLCWEWDPDVEGIVGGFWANIEDPPLALPGSWPEIDDASDSDDLDDGDRSWYLSPLLLGNDLA